VGVSVFVGVAVFVGVEVFVEVGVEVGKAVDVRVGFLVGVLKGVPRISNLLRMVLAEVDVMGTSRKPKNGTIG